MRRAWSSRFQRVLRTSVGLAALALTSSVCGSGLVFLLLLIEGIPADTGGQMWILSVCAAGYVLLSLVVGTAWAIFLQRRTVIWFLLGRRPTALEARRALRLPVHLAVVTGTLWSGGTVVLGILAAVLGSAADALGVATVIALGGLTTCGLTYLAAEAVARPVIAPALEAASERDRQPTTVLTRLVLTWALASGVPLVGVLLTVLPPYLGTRDPAASIVSLSTLGLVLGALGTGLLARSVASPLRDLRRTLGTIARGRNDVTVDVDDTSEIGMLQSSVNDLAAGLREQERLRDLFGRHVGDDVVRHVLEHGVSLSGDVREVTALFVDVVDSTAMAAQLPPDEVVRKLNRLFSCVVDAVNTNGGLVNKFQGDAALCVFGAPARHADPATAVLRTARAIRDAVASTGELDLGIGVAAGPAFAGQLGTSSRLEYTVIGDPVNEAARLTEHAKHEPGRILASEAVVEAAEADERRRWHATESVHLRGRTTPTTTWATAATFPETADETEQTGSTGEPATPA